jgi:hypothetical protein
MSVIKWADTIDALGCDPAKQLTGFIPRPKRTKAQNAFHDHIVGANAPRFMTLNPMTAAEPDECWSLDLLVKAYGSLGWWIWQMIGSCVGAGDGTACQIAIAGDIVVREEREEPKVLFPYATWGVGRQLGGLRGRGDGSFGGAQIEAGLKFGHLADDTPGLPKGTKRDGHWIVWTASEETAYSWPPQWPVAKATLDPIAAPQRLDHHAQIKTLDELSQALVQGYGVTQASGWGCQNPRMKDGLLVGKRDTTWNHQTWFGAYTKLKGPRKWLWGNNWGPNAHGVCPYLAEKYGSFGFNGGVMWIEDADAMRIINEGETFARSTAGFPLREIDWSVAKWW